MRPATRRRRRASVPGGDVLQWQIPGRWQPADEPEPGGAAIARGGAGINESFTVRKISYGEGVERVFPVFSPNIESIKVVRRGKVRRAKLYYLRDRRGKSARIAEKQETVAERTARVEAKTAKKAKEKAAKLAAGK